MFTFDIENPDKLFFTSDTHFGHYNIAKYCHRPFESRSAMDSALIDNWNSVVPEDGIVVHCGDFTLTHKEDLGKYLALFRKLNGSILLCRGNHDRIPLVTEPIEKLIASVDIAQINVEGIKIMASHYPMLAYPADFQVFGHIHTLSDGSCHGVDGEVSKILKNSQYDVGVDQNNYKPVSYWQLCDIFRIKRIKQQ